MRTVTRLVLCVFAVTGLMISTGCKSDCEKAYDHVIELAEKEKVPEEALKGMKEEKARKEGIEKCQKEDPSQVKCALEAKTMEDLGKCDSKKE